MKVIVADDSRVMRSIIDKSIKSLGLESLHAGNGHEVLEILKAHGKEIALILLDWNMPVMNGLEVLESMKANNLFQNIPVLMVSTESEDAKMDLAFKAGARGYLSKPFTPDRLSQLIRDTIRT
jgi:two-component system, chemotaxis family, chemotaxis protein CheY